MSITVSRLAAVITMMVGVWLGPSSASAEKRLALIIAIDEYKKLSTLSTTSQAAGLQDVLKKVAKFEVTWVAAANTESLAILRKNIDEFAAKIEPGDIVVAYYAGHAISVKGRNYLLPADYSSPADPATGAYPAHELVKTIEAKAPKVNLIVLDACRNNPTNRDGAGLASMEASTLQAGTRIDFAANIGEAAQDEGVFVEALIEELQRPGLGVDEVFINVRQAVMKKSKNQQNPTSFSRMTVNFYFVPPDLEADRALSVLARAADSLPRGDIGQTRAVQALLQHGRSLAGTNLQGLTFVTAQFGRGDFSRADLTGSELIRANLSGANLSRVRLAFATLTAARLNGANLERTRMSFATAECATIDGKEVCTDFAGVQASDSVWLGVKAQKAQFSKATLTGARFMFTDLRGASFDGADLSNAFFVGTDLRGATFKGATLNNTDLTGATLDETTVLSPAQRKGACEIKLSPFGLPVNMSVVVIEDIPNSRFDGGYEHARMLDERYGFMFFAKGLTPCEKRNLSADDWYPIWQARGEEHVRTDVGVGFSHKFLEQAGRRAAVRQRIEQHFKSMAGR
jgi:uncharacterized protein YjbI with pentapeptide repeats